MSHHLKDAIASVYGKSELADAIIKRRFSNFITETEEAQNLRVEASSELEELTPDELDDVLEDIMAYTFLDTGKVATKKLMGVVVMLTERIAKLEDNIDRIENELPEMDSIDEENIESQMTAFRKTLVGSRAGDLHLFYNETTFKQLKADTRYRLAKELVEYTDSIGKQPMTLWSLLTNTRGVM